MLRVPNRNATTLLKAIRKHVAPGSIIISDEWRAYNKIKEQSGYNYKHSTICHKYNFVDPQGNYSYINYKYIMLYLIKILFCIIFYIKKQFINIMFN